jgi:hypothetical protein
MTNQPTQLFANNAQITSRTFAGYGHYNVTIEVNYDYTFTYTTTSVDLIHELKDDDTRIEAIEFLIDKGLSVEGIEKSDIFEYIY